MVSCQSRVSCPQGLGVLVLDTNRTHSEGVRAHQDTKKRERTWGQARPAGNTPSPPPGASLGAAWCLRQASEAAGATSSPSSLPGGEPSTAQPGHTTAASPSSTPAEPGRAFPQRETARSKTFPSPDLRRVLPAKQHGAQAEARRTGDSCCETFFFLFFYFF